MEGYKPQDFSFLTAVRISTTLCVIYLGVDRLMTMFNTIREYEQQEYYSMFRDTVRWIRETNEPE